MKPNGVKDRQLATFKVPEDSTCRKAESAAAPPPPAGIGVQAAADGHQSGGDAGGDDLAERLVAVSVIGYSSSVGVRRGWGSRRFVAEFARNVLRACHDALGVFVPVGGDHLGGTRHTDGAYTGAGVVEHRCRDAPDALFVLEIVVGAALVADSRQVRPERGGVGDRRRGARCQPQRDDALELRVAQVRQHRLAGRRRVGRTGIADARRHLDRRRADHLVDVGHPSAAVHQQMRGCPVASAISRSVDCAAERMSRSARQAPANPRAPIPIR